MHSRPRMSPSWGPGQVASGKMENEDYQHYKDRAPPWIKLHVKTLESYKFSRLQDASKAHLMLIWLLASRTGNNLPYDPRMGRRAHRCPCYGGP